jgi:hypothetical protein
MEIIAKWAAVDLAKHVCKGYLRYKDGLEIEKVFRRKRLYRPCQIGAWQQHRFASIHLPMEYSISIWLSLKPVL